MPTLSDTILSRIMPPEYLRMYGGRGQLPLEEQDRINRQINLNTQARFDEKEPPGIGEAISAAASVARQPGPLGTAFTGALGLKALEDIGGTLMQSHGFGGTQGRRSRLSDLTRHRRWASESLAKARRGIYQTVTEDPSGRGVGSAVANYFNSIGGIYGKGKTNEKKLRQEGFDNKQALSDLLFKGEYTFSRKPEAYGRARGALTKERTITLDQFLQFAPTEMSSAIRSFQASPAFSTAERDIDELLEINRILAQPLSAGADIGKPPLVRQFMDWSDYDVRQRYQFS